MITYDYCLDTTLNEKKAPERYLPSLLPKTLTNLSLIEGPNAHGKSTLLHIIALGLYGRKNGRINPLLKVKLNSLLDTTYQKLTFKFKIETKNGTGLYAEKSDPTSLDIIVKESIDGKNYKPISFEKFERKYNLIYDIPNNPTARIPELLRELKDDQLHFGTRVNQFAQFLNNTIGEIANSRNEQKLAETKQRYDKVLMEKNEIEKNLPGKQTFLDKLEKAAYVKFYLQYLGQHEQLKLTIASLDGKLKGFVDSGQKASRMLSSQRRKISKIQGDFITDFTKCTTLMTEELSKKDKDQFEIWLEIDPYTCEDNCIDTILTETIYYQNLFSAKITDIEKDPNFKNASTLQGLVQSLTQFKNSGLQIPQLSLTVADLVEILETQNKEYLTINNRYERLNNILGLLRNIETSVISLKNELNALKSEKIAKEKHSQDYDGYYEQKAARDKAKVDIDCIKAKCDQYFAKCISKGFDRKKLLEPGVDLLKEVKTDSVIREFLLFDEYQIQKKINELSKEITEQSSQLPGLRIIINTLDKDVKQFEQMKPHKYQMISDKLSDLHHKTLILSQNILRDYNNYLTQLIEVSTNPSLKETIEENETVKKYHNEVFKYLGKRIGTFRHVNSVYTAKIVNVISKTITTEDNDVIHIDSMSTGQTMSAYLLSLLNVPSNDKRKIIALFDEIAMMDEISLEPVQAKMRELLEQDRLILGILVQKTKVMKVTAL